VLDKSGTILICGGGIGGLTLALALAKWGRRSRILEARSEFSTAGAGIQLGPNATRLLGGLGVTERLSAKAVSPHSIHVRDAQSGRPLADLPLGSWIAKRHDAPYWVLHRADLQAALLETARASPLIEISTGFKVAAIDERDDRVVVTGEAGDVAEGPFVVGADGVWSEVRRRLFPDFNLRYAGTTAARTIVAMDDVPADHRDLRTGVWLAPSAHFVHYPISGGAALAVVVITRAPQPDVGWGLPCPAEEVTACAKPFDGALRELLSRGQDWQRWALFDPKPLRRWSRGRVTLLGDAAHPILPFLAQGGAMAIEDAVVLGWEVARGYGNHGHVFAAYEAQRVGRVTHIQKASRDNGIAYHLSGLSASARNMALRTTPAHLLMQRYDWVYAWHHDMDYGEVEL
jgi:2-polyprenyl-6-methoxyphenol hydroxylase-like FAD-dependent oxidoreductase